MTATMVGQHPSMVRLRDQIARAAALPFPVIIHGETGVGKELVAAAIHEACPKRGKLVPINVTTLTEHLAESELFGVGQGAFTGASRSRAGLLEDASEGTLFLDEAADLPLPLQAKLLRALDSGEMRRVGTNDVRRVRFRLILAVSRSPEELVDTGRWRADFFHRAAGILVHVPPLRDRASDIPVLVNHFLCEYDRPQLEPDALRSLLTLRWAGNVRQLRRAVERALFDADGGLDCHKLLSTALAMQGTSVASPEPAGVTERDANARHIRAVLEAASGDTDHAARVLGISRSQLYRRMHALGIAPPRRRSGAHEQPTSHPTVRVGANSYLRICE